MRTSGRRASALALAAVAAVAAPPPRRGSKGGKGHYISKEMNAAVTREHGKGAKFLDARREWCEQWPDWEEQRKHCFIKESPNLECDNSRCPACNPQQ